MNTLDTNKYCGFNLSKIEIDIKQLINRISKLNKKFKIAITISPSNFILLDLFRGYVIHELYIEENNKGYYSVFYTCNCIDSKFCDCNFFVSNNKINTSLVQNVQNIHMEFDKFNDKLVSDNYFNNIYALINHRLLSDIVLLHNKIVFNCWKIHLDYNLHIYVPHELITIYTIFNNSTIIDVNINCQIDCRGSKNYDTIYQCIIIQNFPTEYMNIKCNDIVIMALSTKKIKLKFDNSSNFSVFVDYLCEINSCNKDDLCEKVKIDYDAFTIKSLVYDCPQPYQ